MLANQFDAFFLDLDGVIYIGEQALPYAVTSLQRLRDMGKSLRFLTNNPSIQRERLVERLQNMGITIQKEEVITSTWATCLYLQQQGIQSVYPIGNFDMLLELAEAGIAVEEENPEAVVVGYEDQIDYTHIRHAVRLIRDGAPFIATNADAWYPSPSGPAPATGAIVAAIQVASEQRPTIIGKPSAAMFVQACRDLAVERDRIVMIGDTLVSDIVGAHQAGISALLISTLTPDIPLFSRTRDLRQPDAVLPNLSALFDARSPIQHWQPVPYVWPQQVAPAVCAVVCNAQQQILLLQSNHQGWELPTARVEPGEELEEAIVRAVFQKTGVSISIKAISGVYSDPLTQVILLPNGEATHFITTTFLCEMKEEIVQEAWQSAFPIAFVAPQHLPDLLFPIHGKWIADALSGRTTRIFELPL
ncbi:hypothetical protein KSC_074320 [Ktedonobacter sp. SOSP1-52]|uniref:HAD-IIA family hydrolase n=1 Tax=Ktedonobacter sp. SOSP1-52 TaxID=2778366 RepID=UPI001916BEB4|nr:HAD-IIA family hydrolase [Ktedonobacter sp. SOSP1-52]GHO68540.1 hypothetical protein KSC_074320 [Ktedonobacter sp. SOSP1-52]